MFSYPRLGTETRPSVDSRVALPTNPAPSYDSGVGYTNGTLQLVYIPSGGANVLFGIHVELYSVA